MGAMGVVVEATHIHRDQRVALKFLLAHQARAVALRAAILVALLGGAAFVKWRGWPAPPPTVSAFAPQPLPEAHGGIHVVVSVEPAMTESATAAVSAAPSTTAMARAAAAPVRIELKSNVPKAAATAPPAPVPVAPAPRVAPAKPKCGDDD
jgi:hypothetical protein